MDRLTIGCTACDLEFWEIEFDLLNHSSLSCDILIPLLGDSRLLIESDDDLFETGEALLCRNWAFICAHGYLECFFCMGHVLCSELDSHRPTVVLRYLSTQGLDSRFSEGIRSPFLTLWRSLQNSVATRLLPSRVRLLFGARFHGQGDGSAAPRTVVVTEDEELH
jgi:hypothetical protein